MYHGIMKLNTLITALTNNSEIQRGSIDDAIETMKLVEAIYKADPEWKKKYYN